MNYFKVVGISEVDYVNKDNRRITGRRLYVTFENDKVIGVQTDSIFCSKELANHIMIDDVVEVLYNRYGSVAELKKL